MTIFSGRFLDEKMPDYFSGFCFFSGFLRPWNGRNVSKILQFSIGVLGRRPSWKGEPKAFERNILRARVQKSQNVETQKSQYSFPIPGTENS